MSCSFCRKKGHNITKCKLMDRLSKKLESKVLSLYSADTFRQMLNLILRLRADVDFLLAEIQLIPDFGDYGEDLNSDL